MTEHSAPADIPDRYRYAVIPHIMVADAAAAIDFYQRAFGAREDFRVEAPGGGILHAEIAVAGSVLMLGDDIADNDTPGATELPSFVPPSSLGGRTSVTLHVYVPDVDGLVKRAEAAGAEILQPPTDMFHGNRTAILKDPSGHVWAFLMPLEDVPQEELSRRLAAE
ncbi:VOC family protein [Streptomyces sp. NBC_00237]|uniref:VOC family protein n=1 Tax=Streptomyces sp. NBC_00237 TaxID=2975687 RepID=UPI00225AD47D|nr:VOC family protein [Streptomyces sp. NBC_00237]MCX5200324.1 VOC family protein [Streptomyces sp. NBC_00237]